MRLQTLRRRRYSLLLQVLRSGIASLPLKNRRTVINHLKIHQDQSGRPSKLASNIRVQISFNHRPELIIRPQEIWQLQQETANVKIASTDIRKQSEDDGTWICAEIATTARRIERRIAALKLEHPTVEAEWSGQFWQ